MIAELEAAQKELNAIIRQLEQKRKKAEKKNSSRKAACLLLTRKKETALACKGSGFLRNTAKWYILCIKRLL